MELVYRHLLSVFLLLSVQIPAFGAINITANQIGNDVVIAYSGSINTNSLTSRMGSTVASHGFNGTFQGIGGVFNFDPQTADGWRMPSGFTAVGLIGSRPFQVADAFEGDDFSINHNGLDTLELPVDYLSGELISGSISYFDETLLSLGINEGNNIAIWTFGSGADADSITFSAAVPEPSTYTLFSGLVVSILLLFSRRRRN